LLQHGDTAMHKLALFSSLVAIATAGIILAQVFSKALAQEHRHPPQDEAIQDKFYSPRIMPELVTHSLDPAIRARANDGD
jgi:hypothetical protein